MRKRGTVKPIDRRSLIAAAGVLAGAGLIRSSPARAQAYPQRPVKVIVPYPAGGGTDVLARLLAQKIEGEFGQPIVIDNRAGGASLIGTRAVSDSPADGYTIGVVDSAFVTNPSLFKDNIPYDTRKDFTPVSLLTRTQLVLSVLSGSKFNTAQELVAYGKANPGKLTFASAGNGSPPHLAGEQFRQATGIDMVTVPYRGGAPAITGFLGGDVDFTFAVVATIATQIASGKVRGLAVTRGRAPQLPDIPGMEEVGYPSVTSTSDMGMVVKTGTPAAVVEKLEGLCLKALKDEQFRALLIQRGFQPLGLTGADYRTYIDREIDAWARVIEAGNIKPE